MSGLVLSGKAVNFVAATIAALSLFLVACGGPPTTDGAKSFPKGKEVAPTVTAVPDAVLTRGSQLYATNCQVCHGDRNGVGKIPNAPIHGNDGHTWMHSDRNLIDIVMNGAGEMGEMMRVGVPEDAPRMPAWRDKLSEEDVRDILAYIKTFWSPERRRMQEQSPMMP